ncbi:Tryptophan-rich protein TspO [Methanocorpusculaceae archaeon Sp1]|uniref:Tryptophan-rich protein TspO n=1 Tax=Methanorbis furvi TaxID=3028299 RepID=A0AAE4SC79_9EURY|nr:Tryptophan-rich protein TspO [Methanocorpusculaceae archaeon Sp1]MDV0442265.1 Tryptophan-rich protein TspO [Methanocorpusculaceae archaeon Ag1]
MNVKYRMPSLPLLFGSIVLSFAAAAAGSLVTITGTGSWFMTELIKPEWQPPNYLFGPVWTVLYFLMGIALAFVLAEGMKRRDVQIATVVFLVQLVLNVLWSYLFFGWHLLGAAAAEIVVLWILIAATMWLFYKIRPVAAYLLIPYLAWVTFATYLTVVIWMLN